MGLLQGRNATVLFYEVIYMLTKRLAACAELVSGKGTACDVGTDHAYLAAHLLEKDICREVIASDVAEGPLEAAKSTLNRYGLADRARVILSDGLKQVPSEGVTDVVIAGMGGETIVHILSQCDWIKSDVNLILQPMTKAPLLRKWLCENGFDILEEKIVHEGKFYYTVMLVKYSGKKYSLTEFEMALGCVNWKDEAVKGYGSFRLAHYSRLSQQMAQAQPEEAKYYGRLVQQLKQKLAQEE